MFRFLSDRYPHILRSLDEDAVFDSLYVDLNGIIHPCTHGDDGEIAILDQPAMFDAIFNYTDRLFRIVGPRKLLYLAIDGVAPRAKMNQQRARRFRSAKDAERSMLEAVTRGDEIPNGVPFDSNCITPGTQFMTDLSIAFRGWIDEKMRADPAWQQGCTVIFSGSEVPGEGEHKLVEYIRNWRNSDEFDPGMRHCMYGLDADLMMLGLVAHVPHFTLIREKMRFGKAARKPRKMKGTSQDADEFHLLEISLLRDMLYIEFTRPVDDTASPSTRRNSSQSAAQMAAALEEQRQKMFEKPGEASDSTGGVGGVRPFKYEAKRLVDDFVFMCMLIGNDFIPNLPHLCIGEGSLNVMMRVYKGLTKTWKGYLTDDHRLHPARLEAFLTRMSEGERSYFATRAFDDSVPAYKTPEYRRAYYKNKFDFDVDGPDGPEMLNRVRRIYLEGLHWCLQYYHQGVSSWNWFYPDFYSPLASDMVNLRPIKIVFNKGKPFSPITQLMAVLPPQSAQFLPDPMRDLMVNESSPVVDFYPPDFEIDPNGKRNAWEAVVIIPFIDETRLLTEVNRIDKDKQLTREECLRDITGVQHWFRAEKYPKSELRFAPVRPSKFAPGRQFVRNRSNSPEPRGGGGWRDSGLPLGGDNAGRGGSRDWSARGGGGNRRGGGERSFSRSNGEGGSLSGKGAGSGSEGWGRDSPSGGLSRARAAGPVAGRVVEDQTEVPLVVA
jgi:5'-3' exonuclease